MGIMITRSGMKQRLPFRGWNLNTFHSDILKYLRTRKTPATRRQLMELGNEYVHRKPASGYRNALFDLLHWGYVKEVK